MNPETITIDGVEYVPASRSDSPVRIVIAQRGWVFVGRYALDGERVVLDQAKVIRKWGTTKGLGQLAGGPLSATVLDPAGRVELHQLAVVATIAVDAEKWAEHL